MATHSGGVVDWATVIKPISTGKYSPLQQAEVLQLIKAILRSESEILSHDASHELFFMSFSALAANAISDQCSSISQSHLGQLIEASGVLIRYIVQKLSTATNSETKLLLPTVISLAVGRSQDMEIEQLILASILKNAKFPEKFADKSPAASGSGTSGGIGAGSGGGSDKETKTESKRSRSDLSTVILQQLTTPFGGRVSHAWTPLSEEPIDCTQTFIKANGELLEALGAGEIVLRNCLDLPALSKLYQRYEECIAVGRPIHLCVQPADAAAFKASLPLYVTDLSILAMALKLPIYEPLNPAKIRPLAQCATYALYCAVNTMVAISVLSGGGVAGVATTASTSTAAGGATAAAASSAGHRSTASQGAAADAQPTAPVIDENADEFAARVTVIKALDIFNTIGAMFLSTRGHIHQNHVCNGAWLLVSGIQGAMNASGQTFSAAGLTAATAAAAAAATGAAPTAAAAAAARAHAVDESAAPATSAVATAAAAKGKSPSRVDPSSASGGGRVNFFKVQQGFGVLNAAIADHCLTMLTDLVQELRVESRSADFGETDVAPEPAGFDVLGQYTALQRVVRVMGAASGVGPAGAGTMQQLLTVLATVSYRKACQLRRVNVTRDGEPISYSDSTTYFNESISCSETSESEEDDDEDEEDEEDSYLGIWFKETFSPESKDAGAGSAGNAGLTAEQLALDKSGGEQRGATALPAAKNDPHEYLELSAQIFAFLDAVLACNHRYLTRTVRAGLSEQQMVLVANILKDLDRDAMRADLETAGVAGGAASGSGAGGGTAAGAGAGASSAQTGSNVSAVNLANAQWSTAMAHFSGAIGRYLHNLISLGLISEQLQSSLLLHLGVSPWAQDSTQWPLQVYARTLSVLVQILLLKPSQEKEAACLSVWHRLVNTLVEGVCTAPALADGSIGTAATTGTTEYDDLNVEHAQLLLFLFHALNLMQKKSVLLLTAGGVIRCADVCRGVTPERPLRDHQIVLLSRLLLFLEYLMKHLYNPPTVLLEQVRWNLFSTVSQSERSGGSAQRPADVANAKIKREFVRKELEEKLRSNTGTGQATGTLAGPELGAGIRPKFYSLTPLDSGVIQEFKLDGLAWNFILCTPDKLKYPLLIDALIDILAVTDISLAARVAFQTRCAVNYCFSLCWKLLLGLPPSTPHVEGLLQERVPNLHILAWSVRALAPVQASTYLIVNSLVKQGMYTQYAESLWTRITEHVSNIQYSIKLSILGVDSFNSLFQMQNPRLSSLIVLDSLISHLYVLFWSERNAPLRNQKPNNNITASSSTSSDFSAASGACELFAFASPEGNTNAVAALNTSAGSVASAAASAVSTSSEESNAAVSQPNDELCRDLLAKLLDALDRIRECTFRAMADNLQQLDGSDPLLESLLALSGENNTSCAELSALFTESVSTAECQTIMFEWRDGFLDDGDVSFASAHFPVEYHMLTVVEAHVAEICRHANYSVLQSLKHTFKSIVYLIYYLLPASKDDVALLERCKRQLVDLLYDIRCQNFARMVDKCLQSLDGYAGSEAYQLLTQTHVLRHTYRLLIDYAELSADRLSGGSQQQQSPRRPPFVPESIVHLVLGVWEAMLDRPSGLRAMHEFFAVQQSGSLIRVLLSFTGTALSQSYATRVLQFFEKLFDVCEDQPSAPFPRDSLCASLSDLGHTEAGSLKLWLSHILLGPGPANSALSPTSATSSNVPTPTNMAATVSAAAPTSSGTDQSGGGGGGIGAADDDIMSDMDFISAAWRAATTATTTTGQQSELDATTTAATQPGGVGAPDDQSAQQNARLLLQLTKNIVGDARIMPSVSQALFQALIQLGHNLLSPVHYQHHILGGESMEFGDLLQVMITLADASQGRGHATLFAAAVEWLEVSRQQVLDHNATLHRTNQINERSAVAVENVAALLRYMCDLLQGLGFAGGRTEWPQWEDDRTGELEDDESGSGHAVVYQHHHQHSSAGGATNVGGSSGATGGGGGSGAGLAEEEDSTVEDSDEDGLSGKLCTYTTTQKEFMNQHWYHCHTCKMVDGVGVCSVCARVCHKNHDLSYAKFGNFFCDCGAKEDGSCQALTQRVAAHADAADAECSGIGRRSDALSHSPQSANSDQTVVTVTERSQQLSPMLEATRDTLRNSDQWRTVIGATIDFFEQVLPAVKENCARYSSVGCHQRAKNALERLHRPDKQFAFTDQLMLATLGSQEGAFENVRSNYAGEQAQTIRQLIATHMVRRIGLCCLSSPHGRRQHLAVAHEKGKVTILQLSALLKQADAAKKKLTLSRLSSAPIPCTIMSLAANPANEDLLAVCGLKECHVLTFSAAGAASSHIVVTPQLESGNFIKRAVWLPGSQTKLALITCDYVKVYELSEDAYSPQYYFVVPSGKIRDCTFVYQAGTYSLLLFASSGYIYTQPLVDESLAKHGAFYVTNTLDIDHPYVYELKGALCEGGAAIYYSHLLQMLFFSYVNGRNFMAPLSDVSAGVKCVVQLQRTPAHSPTPASGASHSAPATSAASGAAAAAGGGGSAKPPSAGGSTGSQKTAATPQALVQWTEVVGHPGLIFALQNHSNNPVVIMLKPDGVLMQEIKYNNTKSKIIDMVAIRHTTGGQERTTLLLLCEDGSLRIFAANPRETSYWLSPEVQPLASEQYSNLIYARSGRRTKRSNSRAAPPNGVAVALRAPGAGAGGPVVVAPSNGVGSAAVAAAAAAALPPPPPPQAQPAVHFPVDYFEHCNFLSDVDFGGNDLLQVYNTQQLKHRLNATGLFVASSRASGFTLEVSSPDPAMVLTGVRVQFGTQDPARAPQSVSVLGRTVHTPTTRSRWFDMPLTRDESIQCNGRLHLVFGPSLDPDGICMLDSVKVYGRTKEDFGWPDDTSDTDAAGTAVAAGGGGGGTAVGGSAGGAAGGDIGGGNNMAATHSYVGGYYGDAAPYAITGLDRMITATLELMDSALSLLGGPQADDTLKVRSQNLATLMLLYPLPLAVQNQSKAVLATLLGNRVAYNAFKDAEMVLEVNSELKTLAEVRDIANIDPEAFFRLIGITRSIAVARPQSLAQIVSEHQFNIVPAAMQMMQQLFAITPNYELQSSIVRSGLAHTEATVHCLVEIIYAFAVADAQTLPAMTAYLCQLLLNESPQISHSAKSALIRLLRPRGSGRRRRGAGSASGGGATAGGMIGSPPACSTPTPGTEEGGSALAAPMQAAGSAPAAAAANQGAAAGAANVAAAAEFAAALQDIDAIDQQFGGAGGVRRSVEAFLGIGLGARAPGGGAAAAADDVGGYQNLAQADEAAIMEIAIALSLQEGVGGGGQPGEFQALQQELANLHGVGQALRALHGDAMGGGANGGGAGGGGAGAGGAGAAANGNDGGAGAAAANADSPSAGGSDDEGSNAATEGSTLRTSPAEPAGSGHGSESGGSGVESIGGASGRSSTYGEQQQRNTSPPRGAEAAPLTKPQQVQTVQSVQEEDADEATEKETTNKLRALRTTILLKMVENIPSLESKNGNQAIPFMQVLLLLISDLDVTQEPDQRAMVKLMMALVDRLDIDATTADATPMLTRCPKTEVQFIILRLISVLMGKIKSSSSSSSYASSTTTSKSAVAMLIGSSVHSSRFNRTNAQFVAYGTANALLDAACIPYCLEMLKVFLPYWVNVANNSDEPTGGAATSATGAGTAAAAGAVPIVNGVLKLPCTGAELDLQPFFVPQPNAKPPITEAFEQFQLNVTEIAVRLPYQILKLAPDHQAITAHLFEPLSATLCEYMMAVQLPPLRRVIRKLLLFICGNKEKFRQTRDMHWLDTHINMIRKHCDTVAQAGLGSTAVKTNLALGAGGPFSYDTLVELTEHLRACQEVATMRTGNWQRFCVQHADVLPLLLRLSTIQLVEGITPIILQLLQCAVCLPPSAAAASGAAAAAQSAGAADKPTTSKSRQDRDKSEDADTFPDSKFDVAQCAHLVAQIFGHTSAQHLGKFIRIFLLETNTTAIRWQAHAFVYACHEAAQPAQRDRLLTSLWDLWPLLPAYGRRTAQFVDLLGYLTLTARPPSARMAEYMELAVSVLRLQNSRLAQHPNAPIYMQLGQVLDLDGYYLESEPCLVCNNPEVPMASIKLSAIKIDSKFTTTTTIVKLSQSHTISRIVLRIADLKRSKMVRTINIYYNNRTVQAVVELKNRPALWHKARKVSLLAGQSEVKIEFALPISACNLMIEYADFYETASGSSESLQCPRCSAAVPANPGVCGNCGENVFQCHKCRAINYDEKDPFLCHSCGFCKYAKFDYNIFGRVCCAVDPIESGDDRAKTVLTIHNSLEKADRVYRTLQTNKQILELLVQKVAEQRLDRAMGGTGAMMDAAEAAATAAAAAALATAAGVGGASSGGAAGGAAVANGVGGGVGVQGGVLLPSQVNKAIQLLAQRYCVETKHAFEELSKIVQKVQACRRELLAYDHSQNDGDGCCTTSATTATSTASTSPNESSSALGAATGSGAASTAVAHVSDAPAAHNRCYGCALASTEQCLTLLRAMATNVEARVGLCKKGLVEELAQHNLRRGTHQIQEDVRQLLCLLTRDLPDATQGICTLILSRVKLALSGIVPLASIDSAVRHEMALLESLVGVYDSCWEQKLRVVLEIFLLCCRDSRGLPVAVLQPALKILEMLICPPAATSKLNKDKPTAALYTVQSLAGLTVDYRKWLNGHPDHSFEAWRARMPPVTAASAVRPPSAATETPSAAKPPAAAQPQTAAGAVAAAAFAATAPSPPSRTFCAVLEQKRLRLRHAHLADKYATRWRTRALAKGVFVQPLKLAASWLMPILFNPNSRLGRKLAVSLLPTLINKDDDRKREMLDLLTTFLHHIGEAGEASEEFVQLYRSLAEETPWRQYLVLRPNVLLLLTDLLTIEIEKIHRLEETTLSSDLAQGYALKQLVELLAMFLDNAQIRKVFKCKLLGPVLQGYLQLRKLVVQRTRLVDDAQEKLLELLEEMTTGTEEETRAFMSVLIDNVCRTPLNDIKTPVFVFERLCSIIHPEENDVGEFFLTLEKDAQQEDFLQGRMLGNPYPSAESGLGPLMRDVKNKICMDCELVALLEDDNGMELLVFNKIISLDLPVKDVYKKVWLADGGDRDTMRVVYRMRGLLGDATEEFIETLHNQSAEQVDNEQLYRMANVLADECGGLQVMLDRIASIQNVSRSRLLLQVLLKLFLIAVKVRRCQDVLCQPELGAISTLLKVLQKCLQQENDAQQSSVTEQLLEIMEMILSKAASDTLDSFLQFSLTFGGPEYVTALLSCTQYTNVRSNPSVLRHLIRVLAALVYGNDLKMALLCEHFQLDFERFDEERTAEDEFLMELFCVLTNQIEHNSIGGTLKDYIMGLGIVEASLNYITCHAPCVKPTLLRTDSDELKEFLSRPSLKYILRFLTGLTIKHEATQLAIARDTIPIIHRLEQVSSDEHVGSLAENLLEALCTDAATAKRVQEVRDYTRAEKKRLAMATREKQLDALGMRTNDKGQVTAKGSILQKIEKLREETGLTCFICREGYACQPAKVLGIYTFTKRTYLDDYDLKPRRTLGYTTVTHFNVVHTDCHIAAIRLARGRDEWESASLQNANTRCNGLLPLWGPDVPEQAFASAMSRHTANVQECTQRLEVTSTATFHDLKLLLLRFAMEKSFHEDAGGGGPQSNMHLVPYLLFYGLYIVLAQSFAREEKALVQFCQQPPGERWLESAYEVDGPFYQVTLSLALHTPALWRTHRLQHLRRLLAAAHVRHVSPAAVCKTLPERRTLDYAPYKAALMMWALVDSIYRSQFKRVTAARDEDWPMALFDYIRRNDEAMLKSSDAIRLAFTEEFLPCTSFPEFCDVADLLEEIPDPDVFLSDLVQTLPCSADGSAPTA